MKCESPCFEVCMYSGCVRSGQSAVMRVVVKVVPEPENITFKDSCTFSRFCSPILLSFWASLCAVFFSLSICVSFFNLEYLFHNKSLLWTAIHNETNASQSNVTNCKLTPTLPLINHNNKNTNSVLCAQTMLHTQHTLLFEPCKKRRRQVWIQAQWTTTKKMAKKSLN